ncbi:hypothetical protein AB1K54_17130 [Microbacterium sp. BWT-B31]|uniref:hypothetical protein n=1 Tax=Microbacterium sp. BWT-B31 TaxID=3232072 RepID=UPI003528CFC4
MDHVLDAVLEIFAWVGIGAGVVFGILALVVRAVDGSWAPVHVVIEDADGGRVARWFADDGRVGEARLSPHDDQALAGKDAADVYARRGSNDRVRLERTSRRVRFTASLAASLAALGILALAGSWVLLFARG